jgi:hypothetical protein
MLCLFLNLNKDYRPEDGFPASYSNQWSKFNIICCKNVFLANIYAHFLTVSASLKKDYIVPQSFSIRCDKFVEVFFSFTLFSHTMPTVPFCSKYDVTCGDLKTSLVL